MIYRELTPEEFEKAPREVPGSEVYTPENSKILGAFNEQGEIVATWTFFICAHIEPVWIREDYRGKGLGMILGRLGNAMKAMLRGIGIGEVYTVVLDTTPVLKKFAVWFGAEAMSGQLYHWVDPQLSVILSEKEAACQQ
jgi:GNAT superfamily N-acetyltransferase